MWSNADEVKAFVEDHKGGKWAVGDRFVLPDIEQPYEVIAVRPFKHRGKFKIFVDLEAPCAVEGCESYLVTTKEVHQWMKSPHLTRCCEDHRYRFSTLMDHAWKTQEQRDQMEVRAPVVKAPKPPRVGVIEHAVLEAVLAASLVGDSIGVDCIVGLAVDLLPPTENGKRDTRRQRVVRAVASLAEAQRITLRDGAVLL